MKKSIRFISFLLAIVMVFSLSFCLAGCKKDPAKGDANSTTQTTTNNKNEDGDGGSNQKDDDSDKDDGKDDGKDSSQGGVVTTSKDYVAPDGYYNYMNNASRIVSYYDFKGTLSSKKTTVNVTAAGGPAYVEGVFMDPEQTYVIRTKVTPTSEGNVAARIIFKGNDAFNHMYCAVGPDSVQIFDCEQKTYNGNAFLAIESRAYSAANPGYKWKVNEGLDVIILTKPGFVSVWVAGKLVINNLDLNNGLKTKGVNYLFPDYDSKEKESRFINNSNVIGFYCNGGTAKFSNIKVYYTVPGTDKNYIDDGKDTNYTTKWQQNQFYLGAFVSSVHAQGKEDATVTLTKNAGINFMMPYANTYEELDRFVNSCEKNGVDYFVGLEGVSLSAKMVNEKNISELINRYKNKSHNKGYYVFDEPTIDKMWFVRKLAQAFTKLDNTRATYTCLLPSYGAYTWTSDKNPYNNYVDTFISKVKPEIVSNDFYPFQQYGVNSSMKTNQYYKDMGYLRKQALANKSEFWQAVSTISNWETCTAQNMTAERVAFQTNSAIAYGATGVLHFMAQEAYATSQVVSGKVVKGLYYDSLAASNKKSLNVGQLLFKATSKEVYHSDLSESQSSLYFINAGKNGTCSGSSILSKISSSSSKAGIIVGVFVEGDKKYVVAVNKDYNSSCTATITLNKSYKVSDFDETTNKMGASTDSSTIKGNIEAGGIAVWMIG